MNHRWGEPMRLDSNNTVRTCVNPGCGLIRRSRHEPDNDPPHWTEYEIAGKRLGQIGKTPVCTGHR